MASASIAQVHRARLKPREGETEGERVVVKVQRPDIEERIRSDTDLLFYLARFLEGVIEETGVYTPTGIVTEFRQAMLTELDFNNEASNLEEFAKTHQDRPYVVDEVDVGGEDRAGWDREQREAKSDPEMP